ncbi:MAG: TlpA family protein disulfide reductase [Campylobacteraceae bacterium]
MKKYLTLLFAIVFLLAGCSKKDEGEVIEKPIILEVGQKVELESVTGAKLIFKRIEGGLVLDGDENKIIIVDIFGTFCEPCKREAPALMKLQLDYMDKLMLVGLSYFENVTNEYIVEKFSKPYNAYYFIAANSEKNKALVDTILHDISFKSIPLLPFKVVINKGKYEFVTDIWEKRNDTKYYVGDIGTSIIREDIDKILSKN